MAREPDPPEEPRVDGTLPGDALASGAEEGLADDEPELVDGEIADDRRVYTTAARFSGPLPPPDALAEYDEVVPGLAEDIVSQWKSETAHRHETVTRLRETDREAMESFYRGERLGQVLAFVVLVLVVGLAALAIALDRPAVGIAALFTAGAAAVWAMRRRSDVPGGEPKELADGDAVERPDA